MKLFIPACGNHIKLTSDWTFTLYFESRNFSLLKLIKGSKEFAVYGVDGKPESVTMPAGTTLEIDRVYIRQFSKTAPTVESDYDSVTFKVIDGPHAKARFWAKLTDVNNIECELPPDVKGSKGPSTAPKKMKIEHVRNDVRSALVAYSDVATNLYRHTTIPNQDKVTDLARKILVKHSERRLKELDAQLETMKDVQSFNEWHDNVLLRNTGLDFCSYGKVPENIELKRTLEYFRFAHSRFLEPNSRNTLCLSDYLDQCAVKSIRDDQGRLIRKWVGYTSDEHKLNDRVLLVKDVVLTITMNPDETAIESVTLTCGEEL